MSETNHWAWQGLMTAEDFKRQRERPERVRARRLARELGLACAAHIDRVIIERLAATPKAKGTT